MMMMCAYHWLTRDDGVEHTAPGSGHKELDSSDVVVGGLGVDGAEGDGGSDDGNEQEEGNGDGLGVEVSHFLDPVGTDGGLDIVDDSASPSLLHSIVVVSMAASFRVAVDDCLIANDAASAGKGLPVAESWHDGSKIEIKLYTDRSIVDFATRIGKFVRVLRVHVDFVDDESEKDPNGNVEKFAVALSV